MARVALVHNHVGGESGGGGGVRLMLELGVGLQELGHRVTVVCHDLQPDTEFQELTGQLDFRCVHEGGVDWLKTRRALTMRYWQGMSKVATLVPDDVDVINAHEWPGLRAGLLAARRRGVPFVWTRNDETIFERAIVPDQAAMGDSRPSRRLVRGFLGLPDLLAARSAAAIVVLSTRQARMVKRSYRRAAQVVHMGPSRSFFHPTDRAEARARLGISNDVFLAVGAAILLPHRRFEDLIRAIALLEDEPSIHALIIGSDHVDHAYAGRLSQLIHESGVAGRVQLPRQNVPEHELRDAYAAADVFVYPNQLQTWGLAPLEALAIGTPVILSSGADVHEVLRGRAGVDVVAPERPDAIAAALLRAKARPARVQLDGTRAWLRDELSTRRYAERMGEIFEQVLSTT